MFDFDFYFKSVNHSFIQIFPIASWFINKHAFTIRSWGILYGLILSRIDVRRSIVKECFNNLVFTVFCIRYYYSPFDVSLINILHIMFKHAFFKKSHRWYFYYLGKHYCSVVMICGWRKHFSPYRNFHKQHEKFEYFNNDRNWHSSLL